MRASRKRSARMTRRRATCVPSRDRAIAASWRATDRRARTNCRGRSVARALHRRTMSQACAVKAVQEAVRARAAEGVAGRGCGAGGAVDVAVVGPEVDAGEMVSEREARD